jgi:MYM-type Zinc finger with FCS sequence motif
MRRILLLALVALVAAIPLSGCGGKAGYPKAKPVAVLNQPGECAYCHRKIENVTEDNLVTYDGVQYVVCSEECAEKQKIAAGR